MNNDLLLGSKIQFFSTPLPRVVWALRKVAAGVCACRVRALKVCVCVCVCERERDFVRALNGERVDSSVLQLSLITKVIVAFNLCLANSKT